MELLRSQKNELFREIQRMGFDPNAFEWDESIPDLNGTTNPILRFADSEFYYLFHCTEAGKHKAEFSPGEQTSCVAEFPGSWGFQVGYFLKWLECLKRELSEPDLWEQLAQSQIGPGIMADPEGGNRAFTVAEAKQITAGIEQMREYLTTECSEVAGAQEAINAKLDYLIDAANRQGRMDWMHTCIGVLTSLGISLTLTPEHGHRLMELLKGTVSGIVKLLN